MNDDSYREKMTYLDALQLRLNGLIEDGATLERFSRRFALLQSPTSEVSIIYPRGFVFRTTDMQDARRLMAYEREEILREMSECREELEALIEEVERYQRKATQPPLKRFARFFRATKAK